MKKFDRVVEENEKKQYSADLALICLVVVVGLISFGIVYFSGFETPLLEIFEGQDGAILSMLRLLEPVIIALFTVMFALLFTDRFIRAYIRRKVYPTHVIEYSENAVVVWGYVRHMDYEYIKRMMFVGRKGYAMSNTVPEQYSGATLVALPIEGLENNI